eukprot:TRINITY_DN32679_c0_g1_i1.p1 TRINITY_DN32679_c0_g1~~TRINITY_DN32679_c0_g1_i1.p1  ORF type:complete len:766 (-),score=64.37 TRINITY_DN32679_c0_g1_i1:539-2836(-)
MQPMPPLFSLSGQTDNFSPTRVNSSSSAAVFCQQVGKNGSLAWRAEFFTAHDSNDSNTASEVPNTFSQNKNTLRQISPWDGIPTFLDGADQMDLVHCVCKTPAGLWTRLEIADDEFGHPLRLSRIATDQGRIPGNSPSREIALHYSDNSPWNIGFIPATATELIEPRPVPHSLLDDRINGAVIEGGDALQTAEAQNAPDVLKLGGGSGSRGGRGLRRRWVPKEILEIGAQTPRSVGEVYAVKPLGSFLLVSGGELLCKVIGIAADDPMAEVLHGVEDVNKWLPGCVEQIREWLRRCDCSHADAKEAAFLNDEEVATADSTHVTILRSHLRWQSLQRINQPSPPSSSLQSLRHLNSPPPMAASPVPKARQSRSESECSTSNSAQHKLSSVTTLPHLTPLSLDECDAIPLSNPASLSLCDLTWVSPTGLDRSPFGGSYDRSADTSPMLGSTSTGLPTRTASKSEKKKGLDYSIRREATALQEPVLATSRSLSALPYNSQQATKRLQASKPSHSPSSSSFSFSTSTSPSFLSNSPQSSPMTEAVPPSSTSSSMSELSPRPPYDGLKRPSVNRRDDRPKYLSASDASPSSSSDGEGLQERSISVKDSEPGWTTDSCHARGSLPSPRLTSTSSATHLTESQESRKLYHFNSDRSSLSSTSLLRDFLPDVAADMAIDVAASSSFRGPSSSRTLREFFSRRVLCDVEPSRPPVGTRTSNKVRGFGVFNPISRKGNGSRRAFTVDLSPNALPAPKQDTPQRVTRSPSQHRVKA